MFGINPSEFIVLLVVAAVVLGPERLPEYAQQLARLVRELRRMAQGASRQVRNEMGPEFDDIDWAKLDPRQYDPRRIVREALSDVWDPDDPLGLKEGNRPRQAGDDDIEGPGPGGTSWEGEKPQSNGGPGYGAPGARTTVDLNKTAGENGLASENGHASENGLASENGYAGENGLASEAGTDVAPVTPPPAFDPDAT